MTSKNIYLVGSLKHEYPKTIAEKLRADGHKVFDDYQAAGPEADMYWQRYYEERGFAYADALTMPFPQHAFDFDVKHLKRADWAVAVCKSFKLPGISSIAELSFMRWGLGKRTAILLDGDPEHWELMIPLVTDEICYTYEQLLEKING